MKQGKKNSLKNPENGENKEGGKPVARPAGRPPIEESLKLSEEMEAFAWEMARGFSPAEAAERMAIPNERAVRYATTPIILARVKVLLKDQTSEWSSMQDQLLTACYRQAITFVNEGKVPWANLQWLIDRLEAQKGMFEKPAEEPPGKGKPAQKKPQQQKEQEDNGEPHGKSSMDLLLEASRAGDDDEV